MKDVTVRTPNGKEMEIPYDVFRQILIEATFEMLPYETLNTTQQAALATIKRLQELDKALE